MSRRRARRCSAPAGSICARMPREFGWAATSSRWSGARSLSSSLNSDPDPELRGAHGAAAFLGEGEADAGDQLLGVDRLVDAVEEAGGEELLALDLGEGGERDRGDVALGAARHLEGADAAQGLEAVLAGHGEVDQEHVGPALGQAALELLGKLAGGAEGVDGGAGLAQGERYDFVR